VVDEGPVADAAVDGCGTDAAADANEDLALDAAAGTAFVLAQPVNANASRA